MITLKNNKKNWLISFTLTFFILTSALLGFVLYAINNPPEQSFSEPQKTVETREQALPDDYINYSDNVGGVSFTEDQITELVRNIYSLDGFVTGLKVDFEQEDKMTLKGKIKDVDKLCELYPELEAYKSILKPIENKQMTIKGELVENDGMADFDVSKVTVGKLMLDKNLILPFLQDGGFADLFDVDFSSIEILEDSVVFKESLPAVLQY